VGTAWTIARGQTGWPPRLSSVPDPPEKLRVRGALGAAGERRVAIVGSRRTDAYGRDLAGEIAGELARAGVCIVSGGAEGIDAAAHEGALEVGGRTIAVLGTGVDVVYPAAHRSLFERIVASGGALVSEYEDGAPGERWTFPRRNRIVSGMSEAVVVVRAGTKSGALITAAWARRQGIPVLAVPGDLREEGSAGPVSLLRGGARVAANARDVLEILGMSGQLEMPLAPAVGSPHRSALAGARSGRAGGGPELSGDEAAALGALGGEPRHVDEVARAAGLASGAALAALLALELRGLCEQRASHYFLRSR
jgi:DNA processing protein